MRRIRRIALTLAACAFVTAALGAGSAHALSIKPCTGSGTLTVLPSGNPAHPYGWFIKGAGSCPANLQLLLTPKEPQTIQFAGFGTSDTLGLCDRSVLVRNLSLSVVVKYVNTVTGITKSENQVWRAPVTLFPLATPFLVNHGSGGLLGAGVVLHRILLNCTNNGTQRSATFAWAEVRQP